MTDFNTALFQSINSNYSPLADAVIGVISGLGDGLIVAVACTALMLTRLRLGVTALAAFAISGLMAQMLKHLFNFPRPPALLPDVHLLGAALQSHSFPSGHATSDGVMVVTAFLLWSVQNWRSWLVASLFLLAAYGRIYGGVHFPLDVVAGLGLGAISMWVVWRWSEGWPVANWNRNPWIRKFCGLALAIEAGVLGTGYSMQPATAQPLALAVAISALVYLMFVWRQRDGQPIARA